MLSGRVDLKVKQFDPVEMGQLLFLIDSPQWREIKKMLAQNESEINKLETQSNPPLNTEVADVAPETAEKLTESAQPEFASNLLYEAELLERDAKQLQTEADAKRTEAYALDPSLEPKKGPGRPKKGS